MPKTRQGSNTNELKPARLLNHRQSGADSVELRKRCLYRAFLSSYPKAELCSSARKARVFFIPWSEMFQSPGESEAGSYK